MNIIRFLNKLGVVKGICLISLGGKRYDSIMKTASDGSRWARVYPFTATGHVCLHEDGTTSGESSYIKKWVRMK